MKSLIAIVCGSTLLFYFTHIWVEIAVAIALTGGYIQ